MGETSCRPYGYSKGQAPKSDIPPNIAPKVVTPEIYLQVWDSSATLIGQLAIVTLFVAIFEFTKLSGRALYGSHRQPWHGMGPSRPP